MNIAVLFDSAPSQISGNYAWAARERILSTNIIQNSGRHTKVMIGDVLIYSHARSHSDYESLAERTYFSNAWQLLKSKQLRATYLKSTVFAWVIQNLDEKTAQELHAALSPDGFYLGMHRIDLTNPAHLVLYRNSLISKYRIKGSSCRIFYSMGSKEEASVEPEELKALGFTDVDWEDTGGHGTIFDDYDTLEHFSRVRAFQRMVSAYLPDGEDGADALVLMLEDLNPRLFNTLGAMARALETATHQEDLAQVGVSARRYMEQLADVLFPACEARYKGMDVTSSEFKNRLLAYVDLAIPAEDLCKTERWDQFRKKLGQILDEINVAIHGTPERDRITEALSDLAVLSSALLGLDPEMARDSYSPFRENITSFFARVLRDNTPDNSQ